VLIERLSEELQKRDWRAVNSSPMAVLNVVPPEGPGAVPEVVNRILGSGEAWISLATFERKPCVRICITNGRTDLADIDALLEMLCQQA
jgi:hypothetical protein